MSEDKEFNWSDRDSIVVRSVDAIAVYTNPDGEVVIRQQSRMGEEDQFIVIPLERVQDLIAALSEEESRHP